MCVSQKVNHLYGQNGARGFPRADSPPPTKKKGRQRINHALEVQDSSAKSAEVVPIDLRPLLLV